MAPRGSGTEPIPRCYAEPASDAATYEYFHGDSGAGLGASHQTGWTGVIARGMHLFASTTADQVLELGKMAAVIEVDKPAGTGRTRGAARNRKP